MFTFDKKLHAMMDSMPESAHKLRLMQLQNKLMKYLGAPEHIRDNITVLDISSDIFLQFILATGFNTASAYLTDRTNPEIKTTGVLAAITLGLPLLHNALVAIYRKNSFATTPLSVDFASKFASQLAMISTFATTNAMITPDVNVYRAATLNALACTFAAEQSYALAHNIIDLSVTKFKTLFLHAQSQVIDLDKAVIDQEVKHIRDSLMARASVNTLYYFIVILIFSTIAYSEGVKDGLKANNPWLFNTIALPVIYFLCSLLDLFFRKIQIEKKEIVVLETDRYLTSGND